MVVVRVWEEGGVVKASENHFTRETRRATLAREIKRVCLRQLPLVLFSPSQSSSCQSLHKKGVLRLADFSHSTQHKQLVISSAFHEIWIRKTRPSPTLFAQKAAPTQPRRSLPVVRHPFEPNNNKSVVYTRNVA